MAAVELLGSPHDSLFADLGKDVIVSEVVLHEAFTEIDDERGATVVKTPSLDKIKPNLPSTRIKSRIESPKPSHFDKVREYARLASKRAKTLARQSSQTYNALSVQGKFAHDYIEPFSTWSGRNKRIIMGQCLSSVNVQELDGSAKAVINAASQNYAGFYEMTPQANELQRMALERLPVSEAAAVPLLAEAANDMIADFFNVGFCISTATGYGSNYLSLPAIIDNKTLVLLDDNCHNSLLTGTYLAQPGRILKFQHNDAKRLETILQHNQCHFSRTILVIEGMYSMEGDVPPLNDIRRLKDVYKFVVFCDEAHSFYSLGSTGRGCIQYWNEEYPENLVPEDLIDIRTGTFSKAVGGVGGFICGKAEFEKPIRSRMAQFQAQERETLSTSQMIQVLWVHGQPTRTCRYLRRLADMSRFCRHELERYGIHVYGDDSTHILPVHTGRLTLAAKLSYVLRGKGVLAVPISAPAVPSWQSRVRLNLSASHTDSDVNKLLDAVIDACQEIGVCKRFGVVRRRYCSPLRHESHYQEELEASGAFKMIMGLISRSADELLGKEHLITSTTLPARSLDSSVIQRGQSSRATYGFGSGGSRWILTFPPHLAVECLLAKRTATEACMTFPDSHIGLASTIAALSRPLLTYERHYMILPRDAPAAIDEGLVISSKQARPRVLRYENSTQCSQHIKANLREGRAYFTIYARELSELSKLCKLKSPSIGMTILVDLQCVPRTSQLERFTKMPNVQILAYGNFPGMIGLPGGFLAGSEVLINELRYTSRGYMFTTSTQPFIMEMVRASLERKLQVVGKVAFKDV